MKRSIHGAKLQFQDQSWQFFLVSDRDGITPGVAIRQGWKKYPESIQELKIYKHHLPAFIAFLRWALIEINETTKAAKPQRRVR